MSSASVLEVSGSSKSGSRMDVREEENFGVGGISPQPEGPGQSSLGNCHTVGLCKGRLLFLLLRYLIP